jgi:hypothetical protein
VAGNKDNFRACFPDLFGLDFSTFQAVLSHLTAHGQSPTTTAATVIVIPLVFHGSEILGKVFCHLPVFFCKTTTADDIARILDGSGLFHLFL